MGTTFHGLISIVNRGDLVQTAIPTQTIEQQIVEVLQTLPPDRAREVLDFALFVQAQIAATDTAWDELFATRSEAVAAWVDRVMAEDGDVTDIDASGEVLTPVRPQ